MNRNILYTMLGLTSVLVIVFVLFSTTMGINASGLGLQQALDLRDKATLEVVTESYRNEILLGNIRRVRNELSTMLEANLFCGYKILRANDILEQEINRECQSTTRENIRLIEMPIRYSENGAEWGRIEYSLTNTIIKKLIHDVTSGFGIVVAVLTFFYILLSFGAIVLLWKSAVVLSQLFESLLADLPPPQISTGIKIFWAPLINKYEALSQLVQKWKEEIQKSAREQAMISITHQVAHDIRSPLTALNMVVAGSRGIDPKSAALIRSSVNRITDIANNLIQSAKSKNQVGDVRETRKEMLAAVVEEIVSEKRLEYRTGFDKSVDLLIETDLAESYGAFAEINAYDFKRVISNLINNSVEAMKGKGIIKIKLFVSQGEDKQVVLEITDTGPGFPADLLAKLGNTQVTQGKEDSSNSGSGLGTLHAAQVIRKYGGEIAFSNLYNSDDTHTSESKHIAGAKIDIFFKPTPTPEWFVPEIVINDETRFLVLDDDSSVVVMWKEKIRTLKLPGFTSKLETLIYVSAEKFFRENVGWVEPNDIIIIDYEIMGDRRNGLEIMHEMYYSADGKTGNHDAFLVSSHYDDPKIQEKVKSLGMKIIPKSVVHLVPFVYRPDSVKQALPESHTPPSDPNASPAAVSVKFVSQQPENGYDAVLIDDSPEIRGAWEMHQCGRKLKCYSKPQDFLADCENIHTNSGIYLDLDFGKHGKGIDFIESIYNKGFKNINIVTGYSLEHVEIPSKLRPMIAKIAAKAPPWADEAGIGHIFDF